MMREGERRVALTGIGIVATGAIGRDAFWEWLTREHDEPVKVFLDGFDATEWMSRKDVDRTDPYIHYAVAASQLAVDDAGGLSTDRDRTGVILGNVFAALGTLEKQLDGFARRGASAVSPFLSAIVSANSCSAQVARRHGIRGQVQTIAGACAGGTYAVADAASLIARGEVDAMLAGGTDGPVVPAMQASFDNLRVRASGGWVRPFDRRRTGTEFVAGAAVVVLEAYEVAVARGAHIYAEIAGAAKTNDAGSMISPAGPDGLACMRLALTDAGVAPADVAHVNAHGTGTRSNDSVESRNLMTLFGPCGPPVTSVKAVTGHALGAAGAFDVAAACLSIEHHLLPPTCIDFEADPEIEIDVVAGSPRPWQPGPVLSSSFGFGGQNGCIVLLPAGWRHSEH